MPFKKKRNKEAGTLFSKQVVLLLNCLNTLTVEDEYSRSNREHLSLPIQMQLSEKPKPFCCYFIAFSKSTFISEHFETKMSLIAYAEIIDSAICGYLNA